MNENIIKAEKLYTPKEVEAMNIAKINTLARWRMEGRELPFIKAGARVLYAGKDILDWIESNRVTPQTA